MSGLKFKIRWQSGDASDAASASVGDLALWLNEECVWGRANGADDWIGINWPLIEVLEFLGKSWGLLVGQDRDPFALIDPVKIPPSRLRQHLERLVVMRDEDERSLYAFERAHDLANAFNGAFPSSFWLVRCGQRFIAESRGALAWLDASHVVDVLTRLGDEIADRVRAADDIRATAAIERWIGRDRISLPKFLAAVTGMPSDDLVRLAGHTDISRYWELTNPLDASHSEIVAAARMGHRCLSMSSLAKVIELIKECPKRPTPELDRYTEAYATTHAHEPFERPFDEGHFAAQWLRSELGIGDEIVDARQRLVGWSVHIKATSLQETAIDAVAAWGTHHGPVIIVNKNGTHAKTKNVLNVTLAHEICHLVLDRDEALPVAEVLGGRVMDSVEARARAFAAEFLLPREAAHRLFREHIDRGLAVNGIVALVAERYGVSKEVVAWQVRNREAVLSESERHQLRRFVRQKRVF